MKLIICLKDSWYLAKPYWVSKDKYKAFILLLLAFALSLFEVYMAVQFNKWNVDFYNAIQNYDKQAFLKALVKGIYIILLYISSPMVAEYFISVLEIKWRKWLTNYYLEKWLSNKVYYKDILSKSSLENPDQRIAEDIKDFTNIMLNLSIRLFKTVISLASFIFILWGLSGILIFNIFSYNLHIYGYMVWVALIYGFVVTYITFRIGKPLIRLNYENQKYEANFRYNLVRVKEYSEHIASYKGENLEKKILSQDFESIYNNFIKIIKKTIQINLFNFIYIRISNILPTIISAGRYFSKEITLGNLMQINAAFSQIQYAMADVLLYYSNIARLGSVINRLIELIRTVNNIEKIPSIEILEHKQKYLELKKLQVKTPSGEILVNNFSLELNPSDKVLISGPSGSGKTSLLKAINGLWPNVSGEIYQKSSLKSLFIPQKPYIPPITLKEAICYPISYNFPSDDFIKQALKDCFLEKLESRLYDISKWNNELSLGEQQRIAFCRILINKPDILYLDEATSALDEGAEEKLYNKIFNKLPSSIFISVGHKNSLKKLHNKIINITDYLN